MPIRGCYFCGLILLMGIQSFGFEGEISSKARAINYYALQRMNVSMGSVYENSRVSTNRQSPFVKRADFVEVLYQGMPEWNLGVRAQRLEIDGQGYFSSGLGDLGIFTEGVLLSSRLGSLGVTGGVSVPTAKLEDQETTPESFQLGSGTWDPSLGIKYLLLNDTWAGGFSYSRIFRFGSKNTKDYRLGSQNELGLWAELWTLVGLSPGLRFNLLEREASLGEGLGRQSGFSARNLEANLKYRYRRWDWPVSFFIEARAPIWQEKTVLGSEPFERLFAVEGRVQASF